MWRVCTDWKPHLTPPFTAHFTYVVKGMLKPICSQRFDAGQVLASTRAQILVVPIGLSGEEAFSARQSLIEKAGHMAHIPQLSREKLIADIQIKARRDQLAENGKLHSKAWSNGKLVRQEAAQA